MIEIMQVFPNCSLVHGVKLIPCSFYTQKRRGWLTHGRHAKITNFSFHVVPWMKLLKYTIVNSSNINIPINLRKKKKKCKHLCLPLTAQCIQETQTMISGIEEKQTSSHVNGTTDTLSQEENIPIEEESLASLEWSSICAQVAQFASTPAGREDARKGQLILGKCLQESEDLLKQTVAAYNLPEPLNFSGIVDVQDTINDAVSGITCTISELCTVSSFLSSAKRLFDELYDASRFASKLLENSTSAIEPNGTDVPLNQVFSPLLSIFAGVDFCLFLEKDLTYCLDFSSLSIMDRASTTLATCRSDRRINMQSLESLLYDASGRIVQAGGMETIIVTSRRARLCIAVRASHKHLLPGGVVLGTSNSGATLFIEPRPALELNNKDVELSCLEKAEEAAILKSLSRKVADAAESISKLLGKITTLDLACARAGHAKWLGSVRPLFSMPVKSMIGNEQVLVSSCNSMSTLIEGILHPLLLGPALMKPDNDINKIRDLPRSKPGILVPIDIMINCGVNAVVISGPNTGGKTATMKTLGVAALMAKAGMFLPAKGRAMLPWFDKVLVDIGDNQSLEQSLSTFSGHMRRLCRIIEAGTKSSLVLLDEIGSGTDPSEGAALATAVLKYFVNHVQMTLVTTHYTELSNLKEKDNRFEIASLDFDIETLRPTYHVLWGTRGQSNALQIASSLGFDVKVLARAQYWMTTLGPVTWKEQVNELMVPLLDQRKDLQARLRKAQSVLSEAKRLHEELLAEAENLESRMSAVRLKQDEDVKKELEEAKCRMDEIVSMFEKSASNVGKDFSFRAAQSAIAAIVDEYTEKFSIPPTTLANSASMEIPAVGDKVLIRSLGKKLGTVLEAPTNIDDSLLVQLGGMKIRVKLNDVVGTAKAEKETRQVRKFNTNDVATESTEASFEAAVQTSRNSVDLRGMRVEDALRELDIAIAKKGPMSVLFIIHGMGTGALRTAVLQKLRKHPSVAKFEQESPMNFGCTVVYIQ